MLVDVLMRVKLDPAIGKAKRNEMLKDLQTYIRLKERDYLQLNNTKIKIHSSIFKVVR